MIFIVTFLLLAMSLVAHATDYYVSPNGSGTACTQSSPCSWETGVNAAVGGDRVRFLDGIYDAPTKSGFRTVRAGTSSTNRITWESVNRRGAILRYTGPNDDAGGNGLIIRHSNHNARGFEVRCRSSSGNWSWDCVQFSGTDNNDVRVRNALIEDVYARDSGHQLFGCYNAEDVEIRNSSFDFSGETSDFGECNYLTSSSQDRPCIRLNHHHNIFARCGANYVDQKNQTRSVNVHDNIFLDKRAAAVGGGGDGDFVASSGGGTPTQEAGNIIQNNIVFRPISTFLFESEDGHRTDYIGNVVMNYRPVSGGNGRMNSADMARDPGGSLATISSDNIHCPASDNITLGPDMDHGGTPNAINRPMSECTARAMSILGQPTISSCEIGSVNSTTLVVNFGVTKNGPISTAGTAGQIAVTYNAANQTENSITLTTGTQARITMASAPSSGQTVQVSAAADVIKNSAFIGGRSCDMPYSTLTVDPGGTDRTPNKIVDGRGVCGGNAAISNFTCTNNVGTTPGTETLDQGVFRFYAANGAEGQNPVSSENVSIASSLGDRFRLRIGVRGGGNNAPSRGYALAARRCSPTCGSWFFVGDDPSVLGVIFIEDDTQVDGTPTTNRLSLGGKTFTAGSFVESSTPPVSVAIASNQQVEWEFSLEATPDNTPLVQGNSVEFRIQHSDGTALASYTAVPSITIGSSASGMTGSFAGGVIQ